MKCITGARYTMTATLLSQSHPDVADGTNGSVVINKPNQDGTYRQMEIVQDPISGAIERRWVYASKDGTLSSADQNDPDNRVNFPCFAKGFIDGGLRLVGTDERWSSRGYIETVDSVTLKFPASVYISARDRVTNIRNTRNGKILWVEENGRPTVFEVGGVTPVTDVFGNHIENNALLRRANQQGEPLGE